MPDCRTVRYRTWESSVISFYICKRTACNYVLFPVCLGIVRVYSVHLIALLGIHVAENHVSSQGAFVCPDYRPHISAQVLRVAEGRLCLYPCGLRERVSKGRISLIPSVDINRLWDDTSANCLVSDIYALFRDKMDRYTLVIHEPAHAVSSHFSV